MISVDLNCDLGESFGAYTIGMDEAVIPLITSANVACGYHAGDPLVMAKTVARCREAGVHVGAHPGFPDLMGFGRRSMNVSPAEAKAYIQYQLGALAAFCRAAGVPLRHVKPHGTLVPRTQPGAMITDETLAIERVVRMVIEGVVTAVDGTDIPLRADSICVHGDGEKALLFVRRIRAALEAKGVALRAL